VRNQVDLTDAGLHALGLNDGSVGFEKRDWAMVISAACKQPYSTAMTGISLVHHATEPAIGENDQVVGGVIGTLLGTSWAPGNTYSLTVLELVFGVFEFIDIDAGGIEHRTHPTHRTYPSILS
jgi:hypothetical protein